MKTSTVRTKTQRFVKKTSVTCCITLIVAMLSLPVRAAETGNVWMKNDRASIGIGAFFVEEDTKVRLSSDTLGTGTRFSFQDDLGLDEDDEAVRLVGHYRFKPRHRINFGYFKISSDATTTVLRDIIFEDEVFTTGTTVNTKLSFAVLKILYTYSFFQNDTIDLGVSTGVNIYEFDSTLEARAVGIKEEGDGTTPFPVFGLRFGWNFKPKLGFGASLDYFEIDEGDVEGQVIDILVGLEHQTWNTAALGIGYNDVSLEAEKKEDRDELDWDYDGFFGYARFSF